MSNDHSSRADQIKISAGRVTRPAGVWSPTVHRLLAHLRANGFTKAPTPLSLNNSEEVLTFVKGSVSDDHDARWRESDAAITSAAHLLKEYHEATQGFVESQTTNHVWSMPALSPAEVICHCDFAPYNASFDDEHVVGLFDFDAARPGPKLWDVAYAIYRWVPFCGVSKGEVTDLAQACRRSTLFCDAYGLDASQRKALQAVIPERVSALAHYMVEQADLGDAKFKTDVERGDHQLYLDDAKFLVSQKLEF